MFDCVRITSSKTGNLKAGKTAASVFLLVGLLVSASGCSSFKTPSVGGLDLMNPSSSLLFPGSAKQGAPFKMHDGTAPGAALSADGSLTMESYQKIREAKAQNAVVLQVAGDEQPVRVLPLPTGGKSVFVSELLNQTGVLKKLGTVEATLYRPSPDSIAGVRMEIKFKDDGTIDPVSDYGLRPGDRVQVRKVTTTAFQSLVKMALRR